METAGSAVPFACGEDKRPGSRATRDRRPSLRRRRMRPWRTTERIGLPASPPALDRLYWINTMPVGRAERDRRILILRGGALGDFILTVPAIRCVRRQFPGASIALAGRQGFAGLATASGLVEDFVPIDSARFAPYFARDADLPPEDKDWLRSFDRVISFGHDPDGVFEGNLLRNGARIIHCVSPIIESGHAIDHFLGAMGVEAGCGAVARLELPADLVEKGRRLLDAIGATGRVVAFHPGSGSAGKNWLLANYLELGRRLEDERGLRVVFTAGEADGEIVEELRTMGSEFPLLRGRALLEMAAVLSCCACYVGNDSGITHLAAALGLPVVALFGPTDPAMWAPRGERVAVVSAPGGIGSRMEEIRVTQVFDGVSNLLDLVPIDK